MTFFRTVVLNCFLAAWQVSPSLFFFCCFNLKLEAESEYLNRCYLLNLYLMLPTYTTSQRIYEVLDLNQAVMSKLLFLQYPYNPLL